MDSQSGEEPSPASKVSGLVPGSAPSPQSEAVTNEMQELSLQPAPNLLPLRERKNVLQLKLQQRRTREELVSQGIMPPLKSPAAFHEQRKSLERARTEDYLKRKIRSRPERSELVRMHILEETSAEPSLQAKQLQLKRARLADDLNDKISHRPGPMELIHKNILPVHCSLKQALMETDFPKVAGESSSFDEDSSDALSPDQPASHDSPLGPAPLPSPPDTLTHSSNPFPTQFLSQPPPPPPPPTSAPSPPQKLTNGIATPAASKPTPALIKQSQSKPGSDRPPQRTKKPKESKPKLDSTYAKILHQQQLFLQLQIINQQQQHYNYHTILPAPPKPPADQQAASNTGPSPSRTAPAPTPASSNQSGLNRQSHTLAKPGPLPPNLDEFKVAELKHELKLRGLPVSGTKNDLIERLKNFQEQNGGSTAPAATSVGGAPKTNQPQQQQQQQQLTQTAGTSPILGGATVLHQSGEGGMVVAAFPFVATVGAGGARTAAPPPVMHFGSTSSSPPASPTPSDRSLAGMSPDETSCNGDAFGEMVSSPLTQLSLHPFPQHPVTVKEESPGPSATCRFSQHPLRATAASVDKDQMLQEKDKQIEELTRMLRQKQRLVETLRLQLEQGKRGEAGDGAGVRVKEEPREAPGDAPSSCCHLQPFSPPDLLNGDTIAVTVKQEEEDEVEEMQPETTQAPVQAQTQQQQPPAQFEQQTQPPAQFEQQTQPPAQFEQQQAQFEQLKLQQQEAELQLQHQQPVQLQQLQDLLLQHNNQRHLEQQQQHTQQQQHQTQQQKKKKSQKQQQQKQDLRSQQVSQVFLNQQFGTSVSAPSFSLDLLKTQPTPTLLTDSNGNQFLIALTNHNTDGQGSGAPEGKSSGHTKLQRLKSTPTKLPSQSPPQLASTDNQSKQQLQPSVTDQPVRKGQKAGLHVSTNCSEGAVLSFSAPPNIQSFFLSDDSAPSGSQAPSSPPHTVEVCSGLDQHALFSPPSPPPKETCPSTQHGKESGSAQHMDDLFDILIQSGEISASFKADPDPTLSRLRPNTPPLRPPPPPPPLSP
ncbi:hypothetical protein MATL_G00217380 [Megalops atlanticus]|uniref:SAP domain-containing protein n=1 Tax=Megalops atlanticus TaxID=7932 RepID=A0A9D3SZQ6_MEGAT|nr:hypothetical protein MATL_G00217380 [Megalops atlanticus]